MKTSGLSPEAIEKKPEELRRERDELRAEVQELYEQLAAVIELSQQETGIAYSELKQKIADLERRVFELALLNNLAKATSSNLEVDELAKVILKRMASVFPIEAAVLLIDSKDDGPAVRATTGVRASEIPVNQMLEIWEVAGKEPWIVDDLGESHTDEKLKLAASSACAAVVPLVAKDALQGVLLLNSADRGAFSGDRLTLLSTFGRQCGVAVSNANLFGDLMELTRFNESVLQNIPIGVGVFDSGALLRSTNAVFRAQFEESCVRTGIGMSQQTLPAFAGFDLKAELRRVFQSKKPVSATIERSAGAEQNGSILNVFLQPVLAGDKVHNVIMVVEDVTEEKRLQDELIRSEKMAAKGEMAAEIAHELKNYLTPIIGMAQLIPLHLAQGEIEKTNQFCDIISQEAEKMLRLVRGLMDFSHRQADKTACDLNQIVESTINFVKPQNRYDAVEFMTELASDLQEIYVDPGQIQQVLLNLFANAADAVAPLGKSRSRIWVTTTADLESNVVMLSVRDEGPGVPEAIRQRVFDPGFTSKKSGHGFGLAVCSRIVENHGGHIQLESVIGAGTTVTICLPYQCIDKRDAPA